jgi:translation elongation factor P
MISAGDFRNGVTIEFEGNIYQIIEFQHVKPGKGAAFVRTKLKNIISGGVVEKTFRPTEKCPTAHIDRKDMQYLYADDDFYHFMDVETYDQIDLPKDEVGDALKFVKENEMCAVPPRQDRLLRVRRLSWACRRLREPWIRYGWKGAELSIRLSEMTDLLDCVVRGLSMRLPFF